MKENRSLAGPALKSWRQIGRFRQGKRGCAAPRQHMQVGDVRASLIPPSKKQATFRQGADP